MICRDENRVIFFLMINSSEIRVYTVTSDTKCNVTARKKKRSELGFLFFLSLFLLDNSIIL